MIPDSTQLIARVSRDDLPLSFAQQRLWFLDRLLPSSPLYNIPRAIRLRGELDVGALNRSLNEIIRRHEVLRTAFEERGEECRQIIKPEIRLEIPVFQADERDVATLIEEEAQRPFDLRASPLIRVRLWRIKPREHILSLTVHHIVFDGWSMGVLFRELTVLYEAFVRNAPSPLAELPIQYADYAVWQRKCLQGEELERQLNYWRRQLAELPALELSTDRPRAPMLRHRGAREVSPLPPELTAALEALGRSERVTLFMVLLGAFQALLYRYSRQEDIAVGTPIAGRTQVELDGLIGFFVNTLVLRTSLSGAPTFRQFLARVREVALEAYEHQDLPFEKLVEELQPQRDLSRNPLFQVMMVLQNAPTTEMRLGDLQVDRLPVDTGTAKFDLWVSIVPEAGGLKATWEYDADLFGQATIRRMAAHFHTLLQGVVADPDCCVSQLPLLTDRERHRLIVELNKTQTANRADKCVHELFQERVERSPDATAVVFAAERLTYRELNARANRLAHYLRELDTGPEALVGICMERSVRMVVAVLGILKSGGAYVPLDPSYPDERLRFMVEDAKLSVLLTQRSMSERWSTCGAHVVCMDDDAEVLDAQSDADPVSNVNPNHLAYVLYTSGSTGTPKGVAMRHGSLANLIAWQCDSGMLADTPTTLQFASLSFDVSFQEIFSTWHAGGALVLASEEQRQDPQDLWALIEERGIQRLFLPVVVLQQLAEAATARESLPGSLREIITAGEQLKLTPPIVAVFERLRHCRLYNHYGPTESHVVTAYRLEASTDCWPTLPPIGRPIANTQIYILDRHLQPVPIGVPGELHIGGVGVARGYLNRPELTAEKFIADPFSDAPDARLYKSGDLARYLPDGNIEYLGRMDDQVKIRGFRIEPGEIEAVLAHHPGVREAAVNVYEAAAGDKRLVGYVVAESDATPTHGALRALLKQKLPEYMVPGVFVMLERLPLTPSGKVDRRHLPVPDTPGPEPEESLAAPRNATEGKLVDIWAEVLGIERVGIHDDFFALGGHSLLAIKVVSRVREACATDLSVRSLFEFPTIAELAQEVARASSGPVTAGIPSSRR